MLEFCALWITPPPLLPSGKIERQYEKSVRFHFFSISYLCFDAGGFFDGFCFLFFVFYFWWWWCWVFFLFFFLGGRFFLLCVCVVFFLIKLNNFFSKSALFLFHMFPAYINTFSLFINSLTNVFRPPSHCSFFFFPSRF